MHLLDACICSAMWRSAMDVVAKQLVLQDEHRDVSHGAQICVLTYFVLHEALIDESVE